MSSQDEKLPPEVNSWETEHIDAEEKSKSDKDSSDQDEHEDLTD